VTFCFQALTINNLTYLLKGKVESCRPTVLFKNDYVELLWITWPNIECFLNNLLTTGSSTELYRWSQSCSFENRSPFGKFINNFDICPIFGKVVKSWYSCCFYCTTQICIVRTCCRKMAGWMSHAGIVSKRLMISSDFFLGLVALPLWLSNTALWL